MLILTIVGRIHTEPKAEQVAPERMTALGARR